MSENSLINAYLSKPLVNIKFEGEDNEGMYTDIKRDKTKDIKIDYNNVSSGVRVFKSIIKKDLSPSNIKEFIILIQWKYPEYTHVEISKYLQSIGWFEQDKENKVDNQQTSSDYLVVKALKDIPAFVGCDTQHYKINTGDVVSIPKVNATPLIKRKVVVEVSDQPQGKLENTSSLHVQKVEKYFSEVWERNHGPVNSINLVRFCMDCASHLKLSTEETKSIAVKLFAITPKQPPEQVLSSEKDPDYTLVGTAEEADQAVKSLKEGGF
jgi:hypothetical protein